eukprot:233344-Amphidinium_carterae.1
MSSEIRGPQRTPKNHIASAFANHAALVAFLYEWQCTCRALRCLSCFLQALGAIQPVDGIGGTNQLMLEGPTSVSPESFESGRLVSADAPQKKRVAHTTKTHVQHYAQWILMHCLQQMDGHWHMPH